MRWIQCALGPNTGATMAGSQNGSPLRIWSAACATGEEPLTIAIALNEAGWFERASIEILASDASSKAIDRAVKVV